MREKNRTGAGADIVETPLRGWEAPEVRRMSAGSAEGVQPGAGPTDFTRADAS